MLCNRGKMYIFLLRESLVNLRERDALFHKPRKTDYSSQVMGRSYIPMTGKRLAKELGLEEPGIYARHCFWRTAATAAASAGATIMNLKHHFDWK